MIDRVDALMSFLDLNNPELVFTDDVEFADESGIRFVVGGHSTYQVNTPDEDHDKRAVLYFSEGFDYYITRL